MGAEGDGKQQGFQQPDLDSAADGLPFPFSSLPYPLLSSPLSSLLTFVSLSSLPPLSLNCIFWGLACLWPCSFPSPCPGVDGAWPVAGPAQPGLAWPS